mgnify:CR=1 FL=1
MRQPQSSSPFRDASQKIYGLGYSLLVIGYDKSDNADLQSTIPDIKHVIYIAADRTADYQTTFGLLEILRRNGNTEDIEAFLEERNLPLDDVGRQQLALRIMSQPPPLGYLTISNALQWRLQYARVITTSSLKTVEGLEDLLAQRMG